MPGQHRHTALDRILAPDKFPLETNPEPPLRTEYKVSKSALKHFISLCQLHCTTPLDPRKIHGMTVDREFHREEMRHVLAHSYEIMTEAQYNFFMARCWHQKKDDQGFFVERFQFDAVGLLEFRQEFMLDK